MTRFKKSLFFPPKNKRLARTITIKTPSAFRKSIRTLTKGGVTVTEKKALALAKKRAVVQLKKGDLSTKERSQFTMISKIKLPKLSKKTIGRRRR